jgi:hypothetical protein
MGSDWEREAVRSHRLVRMGILACCTIEFAIVFAITRWKYPLVWDQPTWSDLADIVIVFAAIGGSPFIGLFVVARLDRRRPARLRMAVVRGRRAFTIPVAARARCWALVVASGGAAFAVADVIASWRVHHAYQVGAPVGAALFIGLALRPGGLVIYPDRLTGRAWRPKLSIAWSAVPALTPFAPGGTPRPSASTSTLEAPVRQPAAPPESLASTRIPLDELDVDPAFLATVVRYYIEHPEQRPDIGTPEGYERVWNALRIDGFHPTDQPSRVRPRR